MRAGRQSGNQARVGRRPCDCLPRFRQSAGMSRWCMARGARGGESCNAVGARGEHAGSEGVEDGGGVGEGDMDVGGGSYSHCARKGQATRSHLTSAPRTPGSRPELEPRSSRLLPRPRVHSTHLARPPTTSALPSTAALTPSCSNTRSFAASAPGSVPFLALPRLSRTPPLCLLSPDLIEASLAISLRLGSLGLSHQGKGLCR